MAGKRMLYSNICESKKLSTVSYAAETLYYRLLSKADDDGNFSAEPRIVLGQCLPFRQDVSIQQVEKLIEELATITDGEKKPLISLYESGGDNYLHINRFQDFQSLRPDRTATAVCPTHPETIEKSILGERSKSGLPVVYQRYTNGLPKSNQININQNESKERGNFKNMAVRYRKVFSVYLSHGNFQKDNYYQACQEFGEEFVLQKFDEWAPDNLWIKETRNNNGLRQFYESLPVAKEADEQTCQSTEKIEMAKKQALAAGFEIAQKENEERQREREEAEQIVEKLFQNPDLAFGR